MNLKIKINTYHADYYISIYMCRCYIMSLWLLAVQNNAEKITRSIRIYLEVSGKFFIIKFHSYMRRPMGGGRVHICPYGKKLICSGHSTKSVCHKTHIYLDWYYLKRLLRRESPEFRITIFIMILSLVLNLNDKEFYLR